MGSTPSRRSRPGAAERIGAPPAALLYIRQSKERAKDQGESLSIEAQEAALRAHFAAAGTPIAAVYVDEDTAAAKESRTGLDALRAHVRSANAGGERRIGAVGVYKYSRISRNLRFSLQLQEELSALGVEVISASQPYRDIKAIQVTMLMDEWYRADLSEWIKLSARAQARRGQWWGHPPYGYRIDPETKRLVVHPEEAAVVRRVFARFAAGAGYVAIAVELQNDPDVPPGYYARKKGSPWYCTTIRTMLDRVTYRGTVEISGVVTEDAHEAIIDDDLWNRVQARRAARPRAARGSETSWMAGRVLCGGCGRPMGLTSNRSSVWGQAPAFGCRRRHNPAIRATCPAPAIRSRPKVEAAALTALEDAVARVAAGGFAPVDLDRARASRTGGTVNATAALDKRQAKADARRDRLLSLYLDGAIERDALDAAAAGIAAELDEIAADRAELAGAHHADPDLSGVVAAVRDAAGIVTHAAAFLANPETAPAAATSLARLAAALGLTLTVERGHDAGRDRIAIRDDLSPLIGRRRNGPPER